ncbi:MULTISPECIES: DUF2631 domain-containing protein [Corynebacterium]|uniref:DUF2631 domain-containing protein n=1 Tax=Corynebacterium TaxID=1716 RepID=UPI0009F3B1E0|nr:MULTISPECIES: DUF2631 domain-containing protein [Corynebacterium]MCX2163043.1 DUF2631 domain-containing protein [Corynebacterium auriscanis]
MGSHAKATSEAVAIDHDGAHDHSGAHAVAHPHDNHTVKHEVFNGVSTKDVPSAGWGWSELSKRSIILAGLIGGLFLLGMLFGNHRGNVENIWLIGLAILVFAGTAKWAMGSRGKVKKTVTARNKPVGHIEPDWAADQLNRTGVYANLTPEQSAALNHNYKSTETVQN